MKKTLLSCLIMLLMVVGMASTASPAMISVDGPFVTQSWDQKFRIYSDTSFDRMEVFSTGKLGAPGD